MTWKHIRTTDGRFRVARLQSGTALYHAENGAVWECATRQAAVRKAQLLNLQQRPTITMQQIADAESRLNLRPATVEALRLVASGNTWKSASSKSGITQSGMLRAIRRIAVHHQG